MRKAVFAVCLRSVALVLICASASPAQRKADLSRLVVVGDSLSAGYQNGSLLATQQVNGYASLVAKQKGVPLVLPLIAPPGIPNVLTLVAPGPPPQIAPAPGSSMGRLDPTEQVRDLAVPGARLIEILTSRPNVPVTDFTDLILGLPGLFGGVSKTQVEWAETLAPTAILLWAGNNDALGAAVVADSAALTPVSEFHAQFVQITDRLAATGATLVIANIPDITTIPYLTSAEDVATLVGAPLAVIGPVLGIRADDYVTADAFSLVQGILSGQLAPPLPANAVLTASEAAAIQAAVREYNGIIAAVARNKGAALVDINALTAQIARKGYVAGGQRLTTSFLGGIFSLDGVHPTNTGYAIIANEFIHALNTNFAAGIPPVVVEHVKAQDPLVLSGVGRPASALHMGSHAAVSVRATLKH